MNSATKKRSPGLGVWGSQDFRVVESRAEYGFWDLGFFRFSVQVLGLRVPQTQLGRALGHFIFSFIGLKRILFTNIFQKL